MFKRNSLRSRLIAINLGLILIGFGGLTLWAGQQIAQGARNDYGRGIQNQAISLASALTEPLEENPARAAELMQSAANQLGAEVSLFGRDASFQASTDPTTIGLVETNSYEIRTNQYGRSTYYANAEVIYESRTLGIVQIEASAAEVSATINQRWVALWAAFLSFSILGAVVTFWLLTSITRPLTHLRLTALSMADGNLSERVVDLPKDEIGEVGNAFNLMANQIEAMVAEQRAFASNASHELRTPITTIQLRTEAIKEGHVDAQLQAQYIDEIDGEIRHMGRLVEDLMMLSRLDANRLEAGQEPIDANRLLDILKRHFSQIAAEKQIDLRFEWPSDPVVVIANGGHLRVVYQNILDNALKYTAEGGAVTAVLTQTPLFAQLTVTDNGEGIPAEALPNIGKRFYRAEESHSRAIPGTGLGLAMVQSIIKLYNGRIHIHSNGIGEGTAVTVEWPLYGE